MFTSLHTYIHICRLSALLFLYNLGYLCNIEHNLGAAVSATGKCLQAREDLLDTLAAFLRSANAWDPKIKVVFISN